MSEKARRWALREPPPFDQDQHAPEMAHIGFDVDGPPLREGEEEVEVAEVSALRAEWEKEQLVAMRSPWTVALIADRLKERNGESLSDEERVKLARTIVTDLTSPQLLVKQEHDHA
jgi:hypothetical protein